MIDQLEAIVGKGNVLQGKAAEGYSRDILGTYRSDPLAVVRPVGTSEVSQLLALANATATPVVPIGGNTGLVGGTHADGALMVSLERMNAIREIREQSRIAIVEAGVVLGRLHEAVEEHGLAFPLFFGARNSAMIGGCLSTNAGGSNVLKYGSTRALCLGLEVVLADGTVIDLMSQLHKDNSGYDLRDLFIGAEGTLGIITGAVLKLVPKPRAYATAMLSATSLPGALDLLNRLQEQTGGLVEAFEYMPRSYMADLKAILPDLVPPLGYDRDITILVELGATAARETDPAEDGTVPLAGLLESVLADMIEAGLADDAVIAQSDSQRRQMWAIREAAAQLAIGQGPCVICDISVPLDAVETFLNEATARLRAFDSAARTNVVAHLGDGNVHFTVLPPAPTPEKMNAIMDLVEETALELGGSFSAEHGIGLSKLPSMARHKDKAALEAMRAIKLALDPNNIMNPGKVLGPV